MAEAIAGLLKAAAVELQSVGIATATLDARLLLQAALNIGHADIIANPDHVPNPFQVQAFINSLARRMAHEPVSKILGQREFYGRPFIVTPDVLDPRADTECLIDVALPLISHITPTRLLDLGSGSGAIINTLLAERTLSIGVAVDLSLEARHVTQRNAVALGVANRLQVIAGPWFHLVTGQFDLIVSNPPYIRSVDMLGLARDVYDFDPHLALDGGDDGLTCYRDIAAGALAHLTENGRVIVEIGLGQAGDVTEVFAAQGFRLSQTARDLAGHIRVLSFIPN